MSDLPEKAQFFKSPLEPEIKEFIIQTDSQLTDSDKRIYRARIVNLMGKGGQRRAQREFGWDRDTIRKGMRELETGIICIPGYSARGRKPIEAEKLPHLLEDIKDIVEPVCQTDPTFRTIDLYSPITAKEVRNRLIEIKGYSESETPSLKTINKKMNQLGYKLKKVSKCKPKKKIKETDMIFNYVNNINKMSKISEGVLRISMDTKATIKVGQFSRGGYCRYSVKAWDHDYEAEATLKLFGINIPETGANHFYVTDNNATSDFMVDALEHLYPKLKKEFAPHTLVINMDNGPENNSRRSQFMKRLVNFAETESINISLAYYPPYHSKYNPIERVWGVLERHWNGELLDSVEKVLGLARTMTWKGNKPIVNFVNKFYEKSVCLSQKAMQLLELKLDRVPEIEKWAVDIPFYGI